MRYWLGLGGNLGDTRSFFRQALKLIEERKLGKIIRKSSLYLTEPVGLESPVWFLNAAIEVESRLKPQAMLAGLKQIESELGREPGPESQCLPRTIDLDILMADDIIISKPGLVIPHPRMTERRFVLEPLGEIAGPLLHPVLKKSVEELRQALAAGAEVRRLGEGL